MAWVKFTGTFRWPPLAPASKTYQGGMRANVPADARKAAIEDGVGEAITAPAREEAERLKLDPYAEPALPAEDQP